MNRLSSLLSAVNQRTENIQLLSFFALAYNSIKLLIMRRLSFLYQMTILPIVFHYCSTRKNIYSEQILLFLTSGRLNVLYILNWRRYRVSTEQIIRTGRELICVVLTVWSVSHFNSKKSIIRHWHYNCIYTYWLDSYGLFWCS